MKVVIVGGVAERPFLLEVRTVEEFDARHLAKNPPSTGSEMPVVNEAPSDAR